MKEANTLWVEKYRPKKIDDLVLNENYKDHFQRCIERKDIGSYLFSGPPGSGKTTLARILCSPLGVLNNPKNNLLEINGSSKETRGISFVQDTIEPFLKIPPIGNDNIRIVFIDEADYLTDHSFNSQRHIIEKYSETSRFIYTCNYISKIPEPIQSRLQSYVFKQIPVDFVLDYCKKILQNESVEYSEEDLKFVIDVLYPDIRRVVNTLQSGSMTGKLKINRQAVTTSEKTVITSVIEIISAVKDGETSKINRSLEIINNIINEYDLDYRSIYDQLFFRKGFPLPAKILVNKYANSHGDSLIPSMNFMAMIFEMIKAVSSYSNGVKK